MSGITASTRVNVLDIISARFLNRSEAWFRLAKANPDKYQKMAEKIISAKNYATSIKANKLNGVTADEEKHLVIKMDRYKHLLNNLRGVTAVPREEDSNESCQIYENNTIHNRESVQYVNAMEINFEKQKNDVLEQLGTSDYRVGLFATMSNSVGKIEKLQDARFVDIPTMPATMVKSPNGTPLPANRINIAGDDVAIATQYPKDSHLPDYLKMLVANKTPTLIVLASKSEIDNPKNKLNPYFAKDGKYSDVTVNSKMIRENKLSNNLTTHQYQLTVDDGLGRRRDILVIHVPEWPDKTGLNSVTMRALVNHINDLQNEQSIYVNEDKALPVIHCRAGVGRTGQLIAAQRLMSPQNNDSLFNIVRDMRYSRNQFMVQTVEQYNMLTQFARDNNKSLS